MRDSLDDLLRAEAERHARTARPRPVREIRARGDRRRRRAAAAMALAVTAVLAGGGATAYELTRPSAGSPGPVSPGHSVSPSGHPTAGPSARSSPPARTGPGTAAPSIVAVTRAGALVVLDPATGTTVATLVPRGVLPDEVSVSPDGHTAYYATLKGNCDAQIYAVPLTGGPSTFITPGAQPAVSPDGTKLAFVREPWGSGGQPAYSTCTPVPPPQGLPVHLVIRELSTGTETSYPRPPDLAGALEYPISHLSWSPDGNRLALSMGAVQDNGGWNLLIFNPATDRYYMSGGYPVQGQVPVRGDRGAYYREGVYLPDGNLLVNLVCCAAEPARNASSLIEEVSTSGERLHLVAVGFLNRAHSSFDATGRWILYLSGNDLFVSRNGRRPTLLTSGLIAATWVP